MTWHLRKGVFTYNSPSEQLMRQMLTPSVPRFLNTSINYIPNKHLCFEIKLSLVLYTWLPDNLFKNHKFCVFKTVQKITMIVFNTIMVIFWTVVHRFSVDMKGYIFFSNRSTEGVHKPYTVGLTCIWFCLLLIWAT